MSTVEAASKFLERSTDIFNAILVKETRQALKSRAFVIVFMAVLSLSWGASVFGLIMQGEAVEYGSAGRWFFMAFLIVLSAAVLFIVPFGAFRSLLTERDQNTYELLSITTLTPRQIVWGKLLSALVQVLLFYSAITPFIAFASLLQGFDVVSAAYLLVMAMFVSMFFSTAALMLGSFARHRASQVAATLVVFGGLALGFFMFLQFAFEVQFSIDTPDFWRGNLFFLVAIGSYMILFQQLAITQLTFESDNRSTRVRITCACQFWLLWLVYIVDHLWRRIPFNANDVIGVTVYSILHWSVVGLFAATEADHLSRRVRRQRPKSKFLRLLIAPLMPGGARGYLYLFLHIVALWFLSVSFALAAERTAGKLPAFDSIPGMIVGMVSMDSRSWIPEVRVTTAMCCYVLFYIGIGAALSRWLRSIVADARSAHLRILTFFIFGAGLIGPLIPKMIDPRGWNDFSIIELTNPFQTYDAITNTRNDFALAIPILIILALLVVVLNARAMIRGVQEIVADSAEAIHVPPVNPAPTPDANLNPAV